MDDSFRIHKASINDLRPFFLLFHRFNVIFLISAFGFWKDSFLDPLCTIYVIFANMTQNIVDEWSCQLRLQRLQHLSCILTNLFI